MTNVRVGLELYSAQRRRAKIWRAFLPLLFKTPAASLFGRESILRPMPARKSCSFWRSNPTCRCTGFRRLPSSLAAWRNGCASRCCYATKPERPVSVVKVGLNAAGREATDQEADLLGKLPPGMLGCIRMTGRLNTPALSAFATAYFPGASPQRRRRDGTPVSRLARSRFSPCRSPACKPGANSRPKSPKPIPARGRS